MEDQPIAKQLPAQDNTNTNIHASSGIRTHDPSVQAGEDISGLRPRGDCARRYVSGHILIE
jgi:hypothetical protein